MPTQVIATQSLFIGGEWVDTDAHDTIRLPFDGSPVAEVPHAEPAIVEQAVSAALKGAEAMASLANFERAGLLLKIADLIKRDLADFAHAIASESGKPIREARTEADRSTQTLIAAAHEARQLSGEVVPMAFAPGGEGRIAMTFREPLGVVAAITPFNFPLNLAMHKIAPAFAAGNAVIHKPAERTPLSALRLARTMEEAGVPKGAYNVITGDGPQLANAMLAQPNVAMITFTGSVRVGSEIRAKAGLKRVLLELGNNSAVIIEPDADLNTATQRTAIGAFSHSGQICISVQRAFVHRAVLPEFLKGLQAQTAKLRIGHPYEDSTDVSSLIDEKAAMRVADWIEEAVGAGAKLVQGGKRRYATIEPTILTDVPASARISCEEVFGPVLAVYAYDRVEDAIAQVNDTPYGLQAGIFTNDIQRAFRSARQLKMGGVLINDVPTFRMDHMPYGGAKHSGIGREGPRYAIHEMTEPKLVCWKS